MFEMGFEIRCKQPRVKKALFPMVKIHWRKGNKEMGFVRSLARSLVGLEKKMKGILPTVRRKERKKERKRGMMGVESRQGESKVLFCHGHKALL